MKGIKETVRKKRQSKKTFMKSEIVYQNSWNAWLENRGKMFGDSLQRQISETLLPSCGYREKTAKIQQQLFFLNYLFLGQGFYIWTFQHMLACIFICVFGLCEIIPSPMNMRPCSFSLQISFVCDPNLNLISGVHTGAKYGCYSFNEGSFCVAEKVELHVYYLNNDRNGARNRTSIYFSR